MLDLLLDKCFGISRLSLIVEQDATLSDAQCRLLESYVNQLLENRPVQHIIGYVDFCDCVIKVGPDVLIPRPETAEMVSMIAERWSRKAPARVVDVCTGSGCIAVSLAKKFPDAKVTAIELSEKALEQAAANAELNKVDVGFVKADVLCQETEISSDDVDLVVSNPPYICLSERQMMQSNVLDYEPGMALFVPDDDALVFYRSILKKSARCLRKGGEVWFEINESKREEMDDLCRSLDFSAEFYTDINGKWRFCRAWLNS